MPDLAQIEAEMSGPLTEDEFLTAIELIYRYKHAYIRRGPGPFPYTEIDRDAFERELATSPYLEEGSSKHSLTCVKPAA